MPSNDTLERRRDYPQSGIAQAVHRESGCELGLSPAQRHVVHDDGLHEQIDVVGRRCARGLHGPVRSHVAQLLVLRLFIKPRANGSDDHWGYKPGRM